ncbi:MAG: hypothetical protein ACREAC_26825, partial [Blastocatellia bacterium]
IETATPLEIGLFEAVQERLIGDGFRLVPASSEFVRRRAGILDVFWVTTLDASSGGFNVRPAASVRIERVENIFHLTSGFEPKYQPGTATMAASVGALLGGEAWACQFQLDSFAEIGGVADQLSGVFREFAVPYFEHWSSLAEIDAELNSEPTKRSIHRSLAWFRCSTGIIVARLIGRPDYEELVTIYTDIMTRDNKGFYLKRFIPLIKSLEEIEPGSGLSGPPE